MSHTRSHAPQPALSRAHLAPALQHHIHGWGSDRLARLARRRLAPPRLLRGRLRLQRERGGLGRVGGRGCDPEGAGGALPQPAEPL
jgi:hypothetical protein